MADNDTSEKPKGPHFWDSLPGLVLLVAAILLARYYILEPYKIPSGSMEPTLIGHEDFGDRIVTNKLAFAPKLQVYTVIGGSIAVILLCFAASKAWKRTKAIVFWALMFLAVPGGLFIALTQDAVASEPKRFNVTVFNYNTAWSDDATSQKINYIKRLWGLPGENIRISGGDIYVSKGSTYEIIRKPDDVQKMFWFPVSLGWPKQIPLDLSPADVQKYRFPWTGAEDPGAKLLDDRFELDGSAPVKIEYKHPVTNIYLKQGRWPFYHTGCPAVKAQSETRDANGILWRNPKALTESINAYVPHAWTGVICPNCKQLQFPITPTPAPSEPKIVDNTSARFYYGGHHLTGDLKLDITLNVVTPGTVNIEVGSNLNRAVWSLGATPETGDGIHAVKSNAALTPGEHKLSLCYVDATVIATLDGQEIDRQELNIEPLASRYKSLTSLAQISFKGFKGTVTQLDLYRDFFYSSPSPNQISSHDNTRRFVETDGSGDYIAKIPQDAFLMLGDNSAGSADGRMWGFVPREELIGRAGVVWWPPSRWRVIK